jgi:hypothetical protein
MIVAPLFIVGLVSRREPYRLCASAFCMTTLKTIGVAMLVIAGVAAALLLWLLWYYRPTLEYAY